MINEKFDTNRLSLNFCCEHAKRKKGVTEKNLTMERNRGESQPTTCGYCLESESCMLME